MNSNNVLPVLSNHQDILFLHCPEGVLSKPRPLPFQWISHRTRLGVIHMLRKHIFRYFGNIYFYFLDRVCNGLYRKLSPELQYIIVAVTSPGILKAKQKLGITFNSDKLGGIDFTKFSKLTMCSA